MSKYNDEYYYQKYLKYKNKYLELKQYEGGGWLSDTTYIYFCNKKFVNMICDATNNKAISDYNINKILYEGIAFKGKLGSDELIQITKPTFESIKETTASVASKTAFLASKAASGTATLAAKAASGTATLASQAASKASAGAKSAYDKQFRNIKTSDLSQIRGGKLNVFKLTVDNKPVKLDTQNNDEALKRIVVELRSEYNKNTEEDKKIDSIVEITFAPKTSFNPNKCNKTKTWPAEELDEDSKENKDLAQS